MSQKRILIAEDEAAIAKALELKLTHSGFEVQVAGDGEEALALIEDQKFDVILLDLVMPKKDGFGVLEALKAKKNLTRVIVLTNLSQEEDLKRAQAMGAKEYFVKSDTPLAEVVKQLGGDGSDAA